VPTFPGDLDYICVCDARVFGRVSACACACARVRWSVGRSRRSRLIKSLTSHLNTFPPISLHLISQGAQHHQPRTRHEGLAFPGSGARGALQAALGVREPEGEWGCDGRAWGRGEGGRGRGAIRIHTMVHAVIGEGRRQQGAAARGGKGRQQGAARAVTCHRRARAAQGPQACARSAQVLRLPHNLGFSVQRHPFCVPHRVCLPCVTRAAPPCLPCLLPPDAPPRPPCNRASCWQEHQEGAALHGRGQFGGSRRRPRCTP
jgi:hypothetical protein